MLHFIGWSILLCPVIVILGAMPWVVGIVVGAAAVGIFYRFSRKRLAQKNNLCAKGFDEIYSLNLKEDEIARVLISEEYDRQLARGVYPVVSKSRSRRTLYTALYLVLVFLVLNADFASTDTPGFLAFISMLYIHYYHRTAPVDVLCHMAKAQPDVPIANLVSATVSENPPKSRKSWALGAAALILVIFVAGHTEPQFTFKPVEGGYALTQYTPSIKLESRVTVPETYRGKPVVSIGKAVFQNCSYLEQIHIPDTVVAIGSYAFDDCDNLKTVRLPENLKTLQGASFRDCDELRSITIPQGVTEIRGNTFEGCSELREVKLHNGIVEIHAYAFKDCESLTEITLPRQITEIRTHCFAGCESLRSIEIPAGVTRIAARAFWGCEDLKEVSLPDSLLEIRSSAFRDCDSLKHITIPSHTKVNGRAFKGSPTKISYD